MKNNRDMFYESGGYFAYPGMNPGLQMMPNTNLNQNGGFTNPQGVNPNVNIGVFPNNNNYETIEQKVNRLERFCKRLDNRVTKLENSISKSMNYKEIENNDMYMI